MQLSVLFLVAAGSPAITGFQVNRFVSLHNLYESCGMLTEKGRSISTPPNSTALTQTLSSYLTFQDRTVTSTSHYWMCGATGRAVIQATARLRRAAGALIKTGRGVSCGGIVTEQDYPDPRVRTVCHTGSIS